MAQIKVWQEDPGEPSRPGVLMGVPRPTGLATAPLPVTFLDRKPAASVKAGSVGLRYWSAASAVDRTRALWLEAIGSVVPAPAWQGGGLEVMLNAGSEVNAYYERGTLKFHVATVADLLTGERHKVATGESPDIVAHEVGHGILDIIRPELWDTTFAEAGAFHESFGDVSAILLALSVDALATEFAGLPGSTVYQSSRVSRLGERMGWGLRQQRPDIPDANSLRDAVNTFFYVPPETLPAQAPSTALSSEPHNFSRVFTAAFLRMIDEMLKSHAQPRTRELVQTIAKVAASMMVRAVRAAPIVPRYYRSIATSLIQLARTESNGHYADAIATAFIRHGILQPDEANAIRNGASPTPPAATTRQRRRVRGVAPDAGPAAATGRLDLRRFGVSADLYFSMGDAETRRGPARGAAASITSGGVTITTDAATAAAFFVTDLFRRNRLDSSTSDHATSVPLQLPRTVTHRFESVPQGVRICRVRVDCGFDVN